MTKRELEILANKQREHIIGLDKKNDMLQKHNVQLNAEVDRLKDQIQDFIFGPYKTAKKTLADVILAENGGHEVSDHTFDDALDEMLNRRRAVYDALALDPQGHDIPFPNPVNDLQKAVNKLGLHAPDQDQLRGIYFALWPRHIFGEPSSKTVNRQIRQLLSEAPVKVYNLPRVLKSGDKLWHPKWKGNRISDVMYHDPAYLVWMHEKGHINLDLGVYREAQRRSSLT